MVESQNAFLVRHVAHSVVAETCRGHIDTSDQSSPFQTEEFRLPFLRYENLSIVFTKRSEWGEPFLVRGAAPEWTARLTKSGQRSTR
jgi:hypothetical protein